MSVFNPYLTRAQRKEMTPTQKRDTRRRIKAERKDERKAARDDRWMERAGLEPNAPWYKVVQARYEWYVGKLGGKVVLTTVRQWLVAEMLELATVDDDGDWTEEEVAEELADEFILVVDTLIDWTRIDTRLPTIENLVILGFELPPMDLEEMFDALAEGATDLMLELGFRTRTKEYLLAVLLDPDITDVSLELAGLRKVAA